MEKELFIEVVDKMQALYDKERVINEVLRDNIFDSSLYFYDEPLDFMEKLLANKKWYNFYSKLPTIYMITIFIIGFILGVVGTEVEIIFPEDSSFALTNLITIVLGILVYVFTKASISATIMKVELLKLIAIKQGAYEEPTQETQANQ